MKAGGPCARCGKDPAAGLASVTRNGVEKWLCHGDDDGPSCYELASWLESAEGGR